MATLSILGLYNYDSTIFDGLTLPTAADITDEADKVSNPWIPNKQELVEYLVMECAELEVLRPSVPTLKKMIGIWSKARQPVWKALYNTLLYKYNPIWNKDGTIEETSANSGNDTLTRNLTGGELETRNLAGSDNETRNLSGSDNETRDLAGTDNETRNLQITDSGTASSESSGTARHDVTGYDANTFSPDTQDITSGTTDSTTGNTRTDTGTDNRQTTDTGTVNRQTTDTGTVNRQMTDTGTVNRTRTDGGTEATAREYEGSVRRVEQGNIGVTMTQEMIRQQRDIVMFNLYDVIVQEFKSRFCLLVY